MVPRNTTLDLPTSVALHAQSLIIQAVRGDLFIPQTRATQKAQKAELLHCSSNCLEFTTASPSLPVHQLQSVSIRAQDSSFQAGLSLTFPQRTIDETELK